MITALHSSCYLQYRSYHWMFTVSGSLRNTDVFVALHIKNISPNYPRDVIQMFDKPNMTITLRAGGKMRSGPEPEYSR